MATRDIPDEIAIHKLITSHIVEIHSLKRQCKTKKCKQNLQRIPRHMRRRAASNNPKRLPKALQQGGGSSNQANGTSTKKKRKKCKSRNVKKRNADPRRTPLHMWFAKRFKLQLKWGQLQPLKNNVKNQRLLYRCSKNGYSIFYLPFMRSYVISGAMDSKEKAVTYLANFFSPKDATSLSELKSHQQCTVHLYGAGQWPRDVIGPLQISYIEEEKKEEDCQQKFYLLVYVHVIVSEEFSEIITNKSKYGELPGFGELSFTKQETNSKLHHVRLFGRKAAQLVNRHFFPKKHFLSDTVIPLNQMAIFLGVKKEDKTTEECETTLKHLLQLPSSTKPQPDPQPQPTFAVYRRLLGQMELIDLVIPHVHLKTVWNQLTANMSHIVGGLRDLEVLALETRSTFFPSIGYADRKEKVASEENVEKKVITVEGFNFQNSTFYVSRNETLKTSLSTTHNDSKGNIEEEAVYVTIEYVRGKPREHDLLYYPDITSLEAYLKGKDDGGERVAVQVAAGATDAIGFVEFGCFSLDAAKCRATALMKLSALEQLKSSQQELPSFVAKSTSKKPQKSKPVFAVVKSSKFNILNLVTVAAMKVENSL